jgi:carbonic anhydrase/acetyltransferase-like protein (isoleucine patch superfamily)
MKHTFVPTAEGARIVGDVRFGSRCSVWYNAVIRGDSAPIRIGSRTNIQDGCILHADRGFPLSIGEGVTVGHGAILHGCTIGSNTLVGMGSILLNGCRIGNDSLVAAGTLVPQNREFPDGVLLMGSPAKVVRPLTPEEIQANRDSAAAYAAKSQELNNPTEKSV